MSGARGGVTRLGRAVDGDGLGDLRQQAGHRVRTGCDGEVNSKGRELHRESNGRGSPIRKRNYGLRPRRPATETCPARRRASYRMNVSRRSSWRSSNAPRPATTRAPNHGVGTRARLTTRRGGRISKNQVLHILRNHIYTGKLMWKGVRSTARTRRSFRRFSSPACRKRWESRRAKGAMPLRSIGLVRCCGCKGLFQAIGRRSAACSATIRPA
jgi:hypothetical protein